MTVEQSSCHPKVNFVKKEHLLQPILPQCGTARSVFYFYCQQTTIKTSIFCALDVPQFTQSENIHPDRFHCFFQHLGGLVLTGFLFVLGMNPAFINLFLCHQSGINTTLTSATCIASTSCPCTSAEAVGFCDSKKVLDCRQHLRVLFWCLRF